MTSPNKDWPHVCRIIWLSGGVVAINEPGASVQIRAGSNGPIFYEFQLPTYSSLFHMLSQAGFSVMGATFIQDMDEIRGIRPPEFRAWVGSWRVSDLHQQWRQVAHAASQKNEMVLMDVVSRIASELMYSEMRLLNLSEAYSTQLCGKAQQGALKDFERFKDLNSPPIYLAIHALFWELAVLKDNLAEFAAKFLFGFDRITTYRGLLKSLSQSKHQSDDLAIELLTAGSDTGWLATFTAYRNLFTHSAPMEQAAGIAFAVLDQIAITDGRSAPQLYYALPSNIQELMKRRSGGVLYKDFDELIAASAGRKPIRETEPDALQYLHSSLSQMSLLAERLIKRSPIAPEMIHLTDADVIGSIQIINR
jgi:hypothetical protein